MNALDITANLATVLTVLSFFSGVTICLDIRKKGSTHEFSSFPFIAGVLCSTLWLRYGFIVSDKTVILVNSIGLSLQSMFLIFFYAMTLKRITLNKQIGCLLGFLAITFIISQTLRDPSIMSGSLACLSSLVFCASPLALVSNVIKTKSTQELPFFLIFTSFLMSISWVLYGFLLNDAFIQVPNAIGAILSAIQLSLYAIYPNSSLKTSKDSDDLSEALIKAETGFKSILKL